MLFKSFLFLISLISPGYVQSEEGLDFNNIHHSVFEAIKQSLPRFPLKFLMTWLRLMTKSLFRDGKVIINNIYVVRLKINLYDQAPSDLITWNCNFQNGLFLV